jgi:type I restriction enzyme, S subunit
VSFSASLREVVEANGNRLLSKHPTWERVPLGSVCRIQNGFPFESKFFNAADRGVPLLRIRDVTRSETETFYSGAYDAEYLVRSGDLLVGMDGDFNARIWTGPPALLNQRVCRLFPDEARYSKRLLAYVVQGYLDAVNRHTSAITVKHLSSRTVEELPIPLLPLREQARLLEALDAQTSRLDAATASLERAQVKLKAYRASVLKAAVEGRLVPTEAELARAEKREYEPADVLLKRILAERRRRWEIAELEKLTAQGKHPTDEHWKAKYKEPVAPAADSLPKLPLGWCWASLSQLVSEPLTNGKSVPDGDGYPVLRLNAIAEGRVNLDERKSGNWVGLIPQNYFVKRDDFLIVRGNGSINLVGRGGRVAADPDAVAYPDTLIRARIGGRAFDGALLARFWDSSPVRSHIERRAKTTAGIFKVNQLDLESTPLPLAPTEEQTRVVEELQRLDSVAGRELREIDALIVRCARLRQAVLKWAFEGKLVDQNPNDEPASVLLDRIRRERAAPPNPAPARKTRRKRARAE